MPHGEQRFKFVSTTRTCVTAWFILSASMTHGETALPGMSADWGARVQTQIATDEYRVSSTGPTAFSTPNRAQNFRIAFTPEGATLSPRTGHADSWQWRIGLKRLGRGTALREVAVGEFCTTENRVEITRQEIVEWFVNEPQGLKHGFTLFHAPANSNRTLRLRLELAVSGTLHPVLATNGQAIEFRSAAGVPTLRYDQLHVFDANGRTLASQFNLEADNSARFSILIDDTDAVYPITVDPLATNANWTIESNQASAQLGFSVASAGDVNGDSISDVIVGAPFFDNGQTDEGRAFVFLGSSSGLAASPVWTGEGNLVDCRFGTSVAAAGDVNQDGYGDIIVGADAFTNTAMHEGRVFVFHGSAGGPGLVANWIAESGQDSALFGTSVACAGDVNADGYADVIVGCPYCDFGEINNGRAFIWHGGPAGLGANGTQANADAGISISQGAAQLGGCVAGAGDVNGDGVSDVIIGARLYDNGQSDEGGAFVFHGPLAGSISTPNWVGEANQNDAYVGQSVSTAGDVNGDGYADVIVGAPYFDNGQIDEGRAFVFLGGTTGLNTSASWTSEINAASCLHGASVATAGDINADGYADVIVGAYAYSNDQGVEGRATVYLGGVTGPSVAAAQALEGNTDGAVFGFSVATAGDVNGDGYSDIIVGSRYFTSGQSQEGLASVFHGSSAGPALTPGWSFEGNQDSADLGTSVASAGDVNGDGFGDVIVGAESFDNGQTDEGRVFLFLGGADGLNPVSAWSIEGNQAGAEFGVNVATAGDVNGDGYSDVIVGSWLWSNPEFREGGVFVYHGGPGGPSLVPDWQYESNQSLSWMGRQAETAGDVNGDGFSDVIIGNPAFDDGEVDEGRALVFFGSPTGLSPSPNWSAESNQGTAYFGHSVGSAGDVNGDGYSDVIIGAYLYDNVEVDEGTAWVWFGGASGLGTNGTPTNADWSAESDQSAATFGIRVGNAGDVNGDGFSDVIIGARDYSNGQLTEGSAFVFHGSASGPSARPDWSVETNQAAAQLGNTAATAGDVNGDGFSDVIVGACLHDNGQIDEGRAQVHLGSPVGLSETPLWVAESNQAGADFGWSVASGGDVNGDGYSDVIVGAYQYDNGHSDEGAAFLYYGNASRGLALQPQQRRVDASTPIVRLTNSDREDRFRLAALGRTPFGRARVRLQWEVKPFSTPLDGTSLQQSLAWIDTGTLGTAINELATGLTQGNLYHWRMRLRYEPARIPYQSQSRWFTIPDSGWQEADLRIAVPPPQITLHPNPVVSCDNGPTVQFSITAIGAMPLTYVWRVGLMPLTDGGRISGATTPTLTVGGPLDLIDAGSYDCLVTNSIGNAISSAATLTVWPIGTGDINIDGQTNTADIPPFVSALMTGTPSQGNCAADLNGDGKLDALDIGPFADLMVP